MEAALDPVRLAERARPSRLVRLLLALSTSPVPADFTNSPILNAHLARLAGVGWTLRQAYYRNWVIWRNAGEEAHGLIVLPTERPPSGDDFAVFVAIEVLRCTERKWPVEMPLVALLVPSVAMDPPLIVTERHHKVERELTGFRLWR